MFCNFSKLSSNLAAGKDPPVLGNFEIMLLRQC